MKKTTTKKEPQKENLKKGTYISLSITLIIINPIITNQGLYLKETNVHKPIMNATKTLCLGRTL
tara:strand:+ start:1032 stop:1223 length:192 start_codon:yes stop_codon:yes gene_type:complete